MMPGARSDQRASGCHGRPDRRSAAKERQGQMELKRKSWAMNLPHPAIVCSGPQLLSVIEELEAGTYPQPEDAIWRGDLPRDLAVRLAKATGATDEQIAEICAEEDLR
jgi:hypothetical protein